MGSHVSKVRIRRDRGLKYFSSNLKINSAYFLNWIYCCVNTIFVEPSNLKYYFHLRPESGGKTKKSKKPGHRPSVAPSSSSSGTKQGTNAEERGDGGSQADTGAAGEDKKNI